MCVYESLSLCVCQPLFQRVLFLFLSQLHQQGAAGNPQFCCQRRQLWTFREADWDANLCTCQETVDHAVQFSFFASMVVHDTSPKPFPSDDLGPPYCATCRASESAACRASETMFNNSSHRTCSPCRSLTFLLIVGIELTANQCQSVNCSAVPRGCWV